MDRNLLRQRLGLIFLILILAVPMSAQNTSSVTAKNCLWKISTPQNEVYLLGSIHFLKPENYPLHPAIEKAFEAAQIIAFEVNMDTAASPQTQQLMLAKGMNQSNESLKKILKAQTYQVLEKKLTEFGLQIGQIEQFKPWLVTLTIMSLKLQKLNFDPAFGIDQYFFRKAKTTGKAFVGLERIEDQIRLFDQLLPDDQDQLILQTLEELDTIDKDINHILQAWETGATDSLELTILQSFKAYPELEKKFLTNRNLNWLPQIEGFCKQKQNYLVIVGAGHLVGENGLVNLLRAKGWSVEQL